MRTAPLFITAAALAFVAIAQASVTETFRQTCPLKADGSLSLDNVNGPVEVIAWHKSEVAIEAVKVAADDEGLKHIHILVDSSPAQLVIRTEHEKTWKFWSTLQSSVHYTLRVPAGVRLEKIKNVNGSIAVNGILGPINLETVNGSITATGLGADARCESVNGNLSAQFDSLKEVHRVKLKSVNSRIEVILPKGAAAAISTSSVNGRTTVEQPIRLSTSGYRGVTGDIGEGGEGAPVIALETVNGGIAVREK